MKLGKSLRLCLFVFGCLLINCFGKLCGEMLSLPVWLDAIGTVFAAYGLGSFCGAIIGGATNIIYGIHSPTAYYYILTNISVGIIVGVCKKKGYLKDLFGILSTAFIVTIASVVLSLPLNYIISDGAIGNVWGDGMIALLMKMGFNDVACHIVGQFYMDFLDKTLTMILLFLAIKLAEKKHKFKKKIKGIVSGVFAVIFALYAFPVCDTACAASNDNNSSIYDFNKYMKIVYNGENGLPGGMANDIVQTKDGVLWIGTYGGLYRYCGNSMEWMNDLESVKMVNCLYTDEAGRLWIGTNDNGLSIFINDRISNVLNKYDGFPSNSVRCITESSNGFYYAGTTDGLVVLTLSGGLKVYDVIPEIVYAKSISSGDGGNVAAVSDNGILFVVNGTEVITKLTTEQSGEQYSCCAFDENGTLYAGTGEIHEGRYICGVVAGMKLKELIDNDKITSDMAKIGYVAAFPFSEVISGYTAFFLGVRSVVPTATMTVKYTDTWGNYRLEKEMAEELIDEGCVIISQHSDTAGPAAACEETDRLQIVYYVSYNESMRDIAPTTYLIGSKINWCPYMTKAVEAVLLDKDIESHVKGNVNGNDIGSGFDNDWVQMLEINDFVAPVGTQKTVDKLIDDFKNKRIQVFKGDYIGVDPFDPTDTIDLNDGYIESEFSSAPSFHYVLKDVITVE